MLPFQLGEDHLIVQEIARFSLNHVGRAGPLRKRQDRPEVKNAPTTLASTPTVHDRFCDNRPRIELPSHRPDSSLDKPGTELITENSLAQLAPMTA
jgi:hypothetical protein